MSLERYAFTVAGPRDFVINLAINAAVPWWVLQGAETVPMLGNPSALTLFGPMGFFLVGITTMFGFWNGMNYRRNSGAAQPLPPPGQWLKVAARAALGYGLLGLSVAVALVLALAWLYPGLQAPKGLMIGLQAGLAGILGYAVQVNAVLQTRKL
jgi:hypothetical protein